MAVGSPRAQAFTTWRHGAQVDLAAERDGLAWSLLHREQEEADAAFEAIQFDPRNVPVPIDSGEWEYLRMERDGDDNQRHHDRYLGVYER
jgi:hypothetical protein